MYFCSRTHSQLSQLVHEINKSPYQPGKYTSDHLDMAVSALASRKSLCVNPQVKALGNISLVRFDKFCVKILINFNLCSCTKYFPCMFFFFNISVRLSEFCKHIKLLIYYRKMNLVCVNVFFYCFTIKLYCIK